MASNNCGGREWYPCRVPHFCTCTLINMSYSPIIIALTDLSNGHMEDMMMPVQESYGQEHQQLERRVREDGGGHRGVEDGECSSCELCY